MELEKSRVYLSMTLVVLWVFIFILNENHFSQGISVLMLTVFYLIGLSLVYVLNDKTEYNISIIFHSYAYPVIITSVFILAQVVLSRLFDINLGRIVEYGSNRIAFGYLNFDYSFLSLYVISIIYIYIFNIFKNRKFDYFSFIITIFLMIASFLTTARTGLIALAFSLPVVALLKPKVSKIKTLNLNKTIFKVLIIAGLTIAIVFFGLSSRGADSSGRLTSYYKALKDSMDHILIGNGLSYPVDGMRPHNMLIQTLSQMGIIVTIFTGVYFAKLTNIVRKQSYIIFSSIILCFLGFMFIPDFILSRFFIVLLMIGLISKPVKAKKSIAHLLSSGGISGAEKVAISIIENYADDIESVYASPNGEIEKLLQDKKINHVNTECNNLLRYVIKNDVDIIHAHDFKASFKTALLFPTRFTITHIHQNPSWLKSFNIKSLSFLVVSWLSSRVVFVSRTAFDDFIFKKLISEKVVIALNYVDSSQVLLGAKEKADSVDLLYVGRLEDVKGVLLLPSIMYEMKDDSLTLGIVGDGTLRETLENSFKELNLIDRVKFYGYQENPYKYMNSSKLLIMPSKIEGFGLTAVEANVLGKPVVGRRIGGLIDIIEDKGGILCENDNDFAPAIEKALNSKSLYEQLSKMASCSSKEFTNSVSWKNMIDNNFTYYS